LKRAQGRWSPSGTSRFGIESSLRGRFVAGPESFPEPSMPSEKSPRSKCDFEAARQLHSTFNEQAGAAALFSATGSAPEAFTTEKRAPFEGLGRSPPAGQLINRGHPRPLRGQIPGLGDAALAEVFGDAIKWEESVGGRHAGGIGSPARTREGGNIKNGTERPSRRIPAEASES
jgi:hypothetical protein